MLNSAKQPLCPLCSIPMLDNTAFYNCPSCNKHWVPIALTVPTQWKELPLAVSTPPAQLGNEFADFVQVEYREGKAYLKLHIDNALDFTLSEYPTLAGAEQDATMVRGALVQLFNKLKFRLTPPVASAPVSKVLLNELREISVLIFSRAQSTPEGADLENISFRLDDLIKTAEAAALSPAQAVPSEWKDWNACQSCRITQGCIHFCDEHWKQFQTAEPSAQAVAPRRMIKPGDTRAHDWCPECVGHCTELPGEAQAVAGQKCGRGISEKIDDNPAEYYNCEFPKGHLGMCGRKRAAPEPVAEPQDQIELYRYRHALESVIDLAVSSRTHKETHATDACCCAVAKRLLARLEAESVEAER